MVKSFQNAIESPLAGDMEQVVEVYIHAVTARYPQARYVVGTDAKVLLCLQMLPEWIGDWLIANILQKDNPTPVACNANKLVV